MILTKKDAILKGLKLGIVALVGANTLDLREARKQSQKRLYSDRGMERELLQQKDINDQLFRALNITRREAGLRPFIDLFSLEEGQHDREH